MQISPFHHLCYSLNVYPGKDLNDRLTIIKEKIPEIRQLIPDAQNQPFGIGLWLDATSVSSLGKKKKLAGLKKLLADLDCYVFTVNAFPYGCFHGERVKDAVYRPDWTTEERRAFTCQVGSILAELLPEGIVGSISTVPGGYRDHLLDNPEALEIIAANLLDTADHFRQLENETGKKIVLALEMEPDCLWESPEEFIAFWKEFLVDNPVLSGYLGVCYDTCHQELLPNPPGDGLQQLLAADIPIGKIQLSAAISANNEKSKNELAANFVDEVYLHQTRVVESENQYSAYEDLDVALENAGRESPWLVHYHVPVSSRKMNNGLAVANSELNAVISKLKETPGIVNHLEIETYTYTVLPETTREANLENGIAGEYRWVLEQLKP